MEKKGNELIPKEWLYNPVVYSQISGDFSLMQQRVLIGILERLQERIKKGINYQKQTHIWPSLFNDEELDDNIVLEIDPRSLGIIPANYDYLKEALESLMKIQIGFPKVGKTKTHYVIAPLFARAEMPYYKERRNGKMRIVILKENVQDFFNMSMGYTIHMAKVAQLCQKKRTPRIYIFLSHYKKDGQKEVGYDDFCRFLGIDEDTARLDLINRLDDQVKKSEITKKERNERLEKWENPYRKFSKVKSLIIEPSRKELDDFVKRGEIDFTFTYQPVYDNGRKKGNPSKILFKIEKGELAKDFDNERQRRDSIRVFVEKMTERYKDIKPSDLRNLVDDIPTNDFDDFKDYCYHDIRVIIEKQQPDYQAPYVFSLMDAWLKERRKANGIKAKELFEEQKNNENRERWKSFTEELLSLCDNDKDKDMFKKISFGSYNDNKLLLIIPNADFLKWLEGKGDADNGMLPLFGPLVKKHYGKNIIVQYRVLE